jgi:hypothetical protein
MYVVFADADMKNSINERPSNNSFFIVFVLFYSAAKVRRNTHITKFVESISGKISHEFVDKNFFHPNSLTNLTNLTSDFETEKIRKFAIKHYII